MGACECASREAARVNHAITQEPYIAGPPYLHGMLTTPYEAFCGSAASRGNKKTNKQQTQPCLAAVVWVCCLVDSSKIH